MNHLLDLTLQAIETHRLTNHPLPEGLIPPNYTGYSLQNLVHSLSHWMTLEPSGPQLAQPYHAALAGPYQRVILLLVDGLSLSLFQQMSANGRLKSLWQPHLAGCAQAALTSVFPSTTATALATLWSGAFPAEHAILGYELWLKEYSMITNMLTHSPAAYFDSAGIRKAGFTPESFLKVPTLGSQLQAQGVKPYAYMPEHINLSGLTLMLMGDVQRVPYRTISDLWVTLEDHLSARPDERAFIHLYWGDLDELEHKVGPDDRRNPMEWELFSRTFLDFLERIPRANGRTLVLMTADHGQITTTPRDCIDLRQDAALRPFLAMLPSGESRAPYFFLRAGAQEAFLRHAAQQWAGKVTLKDRSTLLESGLYGPNAPSMETRERLGDWIGITGGNNYFWWSAKENSMLGRHGGLHRDEMIVPLLGWEF